MPLDVHDPPLSPRHFDSHLHDLALPRPQESLRYDDASSSVDDERCLRRETGRTPLFFGLKPIEVEVDQ